MELGLYPSHKPESYPGHPGKAVNIVDPWPMLPGSGKAIL